MQGEYEDNYRLEDDEGASLPLLVGEGWLGVGNGNGCGGGGGGGGYNVLDLSLSMAIRKTEI